jgi:hypothetical protein
MNYATWADHEMMDDFDGDDGAPYDSGGEGIPLIVPPGFGDEADGIVEDSEENEEVWEDVLPHR